MKASILKTIALSGLASAPVLAGSLYETAPRIGLPESYAIAWSAYANVGYDSNINSTPDRQESAFVRFGVRSSYGEFESADKMSYNLALGAICYMRSAYSTNQKLFPDITLSGSYEHQMGSGSVFGASATVAYQPEPDFSNGISSARARGNTLMWNVNTTYSQPIDSRLSWNVALGTSGYRYMESEYRWDDRQYVTVSGGLAYKSSTTTTYGLNVTYRWDQRDFGLDANNLYLNASVSHAIDSVSSCSVSIGLQTKFIDGETNFYPNARLGYNRRLTEGLSANMYLSLDNENIGTYYGSSSYLSDMTWRLGGRLDYRISPQFAINGGVEWLYSNYSRGTNGLDSMHQSTYVLSAGFSYSITRDLAWTARYKFTDGSQWAGDYTRQIVETGFTYNF